MVTMAEEAKKNGLPVARAMRRAVVGDRFNAVMLSTAREARSLSQTAVSEKLHVSQALVSKWEQGLAFPDGSQIDALSELLRVQRNFFFVDRSRVLASMSDFYHRALAKALRSDLKTIHARCSIMDLQVDRLLGLAELPEDRFPDIDPDNHMGDVERIALMSRTRMGVEPGPIKNLVALIESCGGIVIDRDLEVDDVEALCRWVPGLPKLFFVNGGRPADRIRFSLAHELGHTIMHFGRDCDPKLAEDQANGFASAFLMPAQEIKRDLKWSLTLTDLATLKRKWRVSMQAIARRAWALKVIDDARYKSLCIQISRNGWKKSEPVGVDGESPRAFLQLVRAHELAGYSVRDLSELLFVSDEDVLNLLASACAPNWETDGVRLRLVR